MNLDRAGLGRAEIDRYFTTFGYYPAVVGFTHSCFSIKTPINKPLWYQSDAEIFKLNSFHQSDVKLINDYKICK